MRIFFFGTVSEYMSSSLKTKQKTPVYLSNKLLKKKKRKCQPATILV